MRMVSLVIACLVFIGFDKGIACDLGVQQVIAPLVVSPVIQQYSAVQFAQVQPVYAAPLTLGGVYQSMADSSIRNGIPVQSWLRRELQKPARVLNLELHPAPIVQQVYAAPVVQQAVVQQRVVKNVVRQNIVQRVVVEQPVRRIKTVTIQKQTIGGRLGLFR